jgi:hypothetical protein
MVERCFYPKDTLADQVWNVVKAAGFGEQYRVAPVTTPEIVEGIKVSLGGLDARARMKSGTRFASVFEGLAFDPERVRCQAVAIVEGCRPIGLMTQVIVPPWYIEAQRYFVKTDCGVRVAGFREINGGKIADFLIIPAWTKIDPDFWHLRGIVVPGIRAMNGALSVMKAHAPPNTYIELTAKGKADAGEKQRIEVLAQRETGTVIPEKELPLPLIDVGQNYDGSSASVSFAERLGLERIEGVGAVPSLGPVFIKPLTDVELDLGLLA